MAKYGLGWWRLPLSEHAVIDDDHLAGLKKANVDVAFIAALSKLKDRHIESDAAFVEAMRSVLGDRWEEAYRPVRAKVEIFAQKTSAECLGYYAEGFLGEYLVVLPAQRIVIVRMIEGSKDHRDSDDFSELYDDVRALVR
jgi:hypothetical protein